MKNHILAFLGTVILAGGVFALLQIKWFVFGLTMFLLAGLGILWAGFFLSPFYMAIFETLEERDNENGKMAS